LSTTTSAHAIGSTSAPVRDDPAMRLEPLYRCNFQYPEGWTVRLAGEDSVESQHFFLAKGRCEGRLAGTLTGANHPRQRSDGTFQPDFQGVIETDDGAVIYFDFRGYGRAYPVGRRQIVGAVTHLSDDDRYGWLNDTVAVSVGEVRTLADETRLVIDVSELIWEPLDDDRTD
jgi:hypothetical protein